MPRLVGFRGGRGETVEGDRLIVSIKAAGYRAPPVSRCAYQQSELPFHLDTLIELNFKSSQFEFGKVSSVLFSNIGMCIVFINHGVYTAFQKVLKTLNVPRF